MTLHQKIISIYSELINYDWVDEDITLQNDGEGDYIAKWEHPTLAQPTQEQLDAAGEA